MSKNLTLQKFHDLYFDNKHRNTTYQKIKKIEDELTRDNIIKLKKCNTYTKIIVLDEKELAERVEKVKLFN